jgi:hypothetical protein
MSQKTLPQKLGIKPGQRLLLMNAPEGIADMLKVLPEGASLETTSGKDFDAALIFVRNKAEIDVNAAEAVGSVKRDGLLWFAYPKQTSKIKTDIHRDVGWDAVKGAGFEPIAQVAIDETWSATRFRPADMVKRQKR